MLKTRVITASVLLAVLVAVAYSGSYLLFVLVTAGFFGAAAWESFRLFGNSRPLLGAILWTAAFVFILLWGDARGALILCGVSAAIWALRLAPALAIGLPALGGLGNRMLNGIYDIVILGCFVAIAVLYARSPLYLLSVMAIVWVADVGAYFAGKTFGRRKLAPSISPGKSWEGAIGGWLAALLVGALAAHWQLLEQTYPAQLFAAWGWAGLIAVMTLLVAASVVGDLFESQLKRRAGVKDSSTVLPGHGGVLDRIDALIPALPLAVLFDAWF